MAKIRLRKANQDDLPFVLQTWHRHFKNSPACMLIEQAAYDDHQPDWFAKILKRANTMVAVDEMHDDQLYGYCIYTMMEDIPILHWIYVKDLFRRMRIAESMLKAIRPDYSMPLIATHAGWSFKHLKKKWNLIHNPYILEKILK